jgi:hypothetical protein
MMRGSSSSPIERPERLISKLFQRPASRSRAASSIALRTTQRSSSVIIPERSAAPRNAPAVISSPLPLSMRRSISHCETSSVTSFMIGWMWSARPSFSSAARTRCAVENRDSNSASRPAARL